jgi:hypothetical protein
MALLKQRRVVAAAIETTKGTAESLAADDAFFAYDAIVQYDGDMTARKGTGSLSNITSITAGKKGTATFSVEAVGGATSILGTLLQGCGFAGPAGVLTPVSDFADQQTLTIGVYENGIIKVLKGAMGSVDFTGENGKPGTFNFTFSGIWNGVTDGSMLALPSIVTPPRFASATVTVGGKTPKASKFSFSLGNSIQFREDITQDSGYVCAYINDRSMTGSIDPEADLVANWDVYGIMLADTEAALSCSWGPTGNKITISAPHTQITKVTEADRNGLVTHELDVQFNATSAGNDELTITFA